MIRELARKIGVKLYMRDTKKGWHWNGKTVALLVYGRMNSDSNTLHEIAHWVVATEEERRLPNFGLGPSPDDMLEGNYVFSKRIDEAEEQASAVGILMERALGMDWLDTADMHSWRARFRHHYDLTEKQVLQKIVAAAAKGGFVVGNDAIPRKCPLVG